MIRAWSEIRAPGLRGAWCPAGLPVGGSDAGAAALADALLELEPRACLRRLPDREAFLVDLGGGAPRLIDLDGDAAGIDASGSPIGSRAGLLAGAELSVVVKRHRTPERREALRELAAGLAPRCPGRREAENLAGLAEAGIPVPRPLLWARRGSSSLVCLEFRPHARTLRSALEAGEPAGAELAELARLTAAMHAAGWYHRDLYLEHLLLSDTGLVLIDAGRARQDPLPRLRWLAKDLAALSSSAPGDRTFARLRFLVRWRRAMARAGRPVDARALLADILRREARMRARTPRHQHRPLDRPLDPGAPAG